MEMEHIYNKHLSGRRAGSAKSDSFFPDNDYLIVGLMLLV